MKRDDGMATLKTNEVWLGLDIGGANCKFASTQASVSSWPFPLWKHPEQLADRLGEQVLSWEQRTGEKLAGLAVTMTGELADCFWTRREGVLTIVEQVERLGVSVPIHYWGTDGRFHLGSDAAKHWLELAASNWHATGSWLCHADSLRLHHGSNALLIDVGSTTTDIIPLSSTAVIAQGSTDSQRLASGELVYTGLQRSTVASVVRSLWVDGCRYRVAAETFATVEDAHLLLGHLNEDERRCDTADGRPATKHFAHGRMARMIGEDASTLSVEQTRQMAAQVVKRQVTLIRRAIDQVVTACQTDSQFSGFSCVYVVGHGGILAQAALGSSRLAGTPMIDLEERVGAELARAFPAYAVARLATSLCAAAS